MSRWLSIADPETGVSDMRRGIRAGYVHLLGMGWEPIARAKKVKHARAAVGFVDDGYGREAPVLDGIVVRQAGAEKLRAMDPGRWLHCSGDIGRGDIIQFTEPVFRDSPLSYGRGRRKQVYAGSRTIVAEILHESYGSQSQQHTFTVRVIDAWGYDPTTPGVEVRRKGRTIHGEECHRIIWDNERDRDEMLDEKHERGGRARRARSARRRESPWYQ